MKGIKTYVWCGDIHYEDKYLEMLYPFLSDFNPDWFGIAGDLADFKEISDFDKHERGRDGSAETCRKVIRELDWVGVKLDYLKKLMPKARTVYMKGNHEKRYDKYAQYEAAQFRVEDQLLETRLNLAGRKWEFVDQYGSYKIGKCYFMHGDKVNGDTFAKTAAIKFRKNVRLWHHHTNQSHMITSPLDSQDCCETKAVGCLCDKDPFYMRGMTNRWVHSFLVGYVYPNGNFQDFVVNMINGKFVAPNGKVYG